MMFSQLNFARTFFVYPTGTVDLMTMIAFGLMSITVSMTCSTELVSK